MYSLNHQRWKVMFAGVFGMLLTVGVGRFSYTPMLPILQQAEVFTVAEGGWLAAINYIGYLIGAYIASQVTSIFTKDKLYRLGLLVAIATTFMMGVSDNFWWLALSRFLAGISAAAGMLLAAALVMNWLLRHDQRSELGVHFSGIGFGIALAALFVELTLSYFEWEMQWYGFTLLGIFLIFPAWRWLPSPSNSAISSSGKKLLDSPPDRIFLRIFMLAYFCAGIGYVISATFIVAIIDSMPSLNGKGTWVFLLIGLSAIPATVAWDRIARKVGPFRAMVFGFIFQLISPVLLLGETTLAIALLSAILYGGSFVGLVSLVLSVAGRYYPTKPAKMMGVMTISYGVGQIGAPAITGVFAQMSGNYSFGLYMVIVSQIVGSFLCWYLSLQPDGQRIAN